MSKILIGVISDTHGLLRPEALAALQGVALIIHAGDVGKPAVLEQLGQLAPVRAVRGNVDRGPWADALSERERVEVGSTTLYVIHQLPALDLDPVAAGLQAVIYGHSHKPRIEWREGVMLLNPGSAGPRRFKLPASLARLEVEDGRVAAQLVNLIHLQE
jgi:uncharacterized protein